LYHLSPAQLTAVIEAKAPDTLGSHAIRNLKNNVRWLLRQGEALQLIAPLDQPLLSWRNTRYLGSNWSPKRGEWPAPKSNPYALRPLPPVLAAEFEAFAAWSTALYAADRPARLQKRLPTIDRYHQSVSFVAGFAHRIEGMPIDSITLQTLTEPEFAERYTAWWIARRGKVTASIQKVLINLRIMAKYWLKDEPRAAALQTILKRLPHLEAVQDKGARWLSLAQLEKAALSQYPGCRGNSSNGWRGRNPSRRRPIASCMRHCGSVNR
jgi:hypothetical protein